MLLVLHRERPGWRARQSDSPYPSEHAARACQLCALNHPLAVVVHAAEMFRRDGDRLAIVEFAPVKVAKLAPGVTGGSAQIGSTDRALS